MATPAKSSRTKTVHTTVPGLSMDDAAAQILAAFGPSGESANAAAEAPPSDPAAPVVAASESEPAKEPAKAPEPPQESKSPPLVPEASYRPGLYRVNERGEGELVPDEEIAADQLRMADYTKKTMALAEERRQAEADRAALKAERELMAAEKARTAALLKQAMPPEPDWDALYQQDPQNMAVVHAAWTIRQQAQQRAEREAYEANQKVQTERQATERARLLELIPEWRTPDVAQREMQELSQYIAQSGLSQDKVNALVSDAAAIKLARKAMLAERGEVIAPAKAQAAQVKIDRVKVAAPGAASIPKAPPSALDQKMAQLQRTGKVKDAAAVMAEFLK